MRTKLAKNPGARFTPGRILSINETPEFFKAREMDRGFFYLTLALIAAWMIAAGFFAKLIVKNSKQKTEIHVRN